VLNSYQHGVEAVEVECVLRAPESLLWNI